jgi:TPP-dependent pyruvate/acetoin dehydrogenase alpha subunit
VDWTADPEVMAEYRQCIDADEDRQGLITSLRPDEHLRMYEGMLRNRLFDIMLKRWVRQGVMSKAWLGTGEEAVTVGAVAALRRGDVVGPMIRNSGALHEMGMSLLDIFRGQLGTGDSPTQGRDIHVGDLSLGVVAPISMVGSLVPVCAGAALAFKTRKDGNLALTWAGDGTTRTTAFHEGLISARALDLPLIVIVQDNHIALGTLPDGHSRAPMEEIPAIYNLPSYRCDGNHVLDVFAATRLASSRCRSGEGPVLINAKTFRMGGHATHDEDESRKILSPELFETWGKRDPIAMYETYLAESGLQLADSGSNREALERVEAQVTAEVDEAAALALQSRERNMPKPETQKLGVFNPE